MRGAAGGAHHLLRVPELFPLLLLGVAVLSRVLADHPDLRLRLIDEIVPQALRSTVAHSLATLPASTIPFVAGLVGLLLSGTGVVFSAYQTLNHVAAVRHRLRAGFVSRYVRVFAVLAMLMAGALAAGSLTVVATALPGQPGVQRAAAVARVGAGRLRGAAARRQVAAGPARAGPGPFGQDGGERQAAPETACGQARSRGADCCPGLNRRSHPVPRRWPESLARVMTTSGGLNRIRETSRIRPGARTVCAPAALSFAGHGQSANTGIPRKGTQCIGAVKGG